MKAQTLNATARSPIGTPTTNSLLGGDHNAWANKKSKKAAELRQGKPEKLKSSFLEDFGFAKGLAARILAALPIGKEGILGGRLPEATALM